MKFKLDFPRDEWEGIDPFKILIGGIFIFFILTIVLVFIFLPDESDGELVVREDPHEEKILRRASQRCGSADNVQWIQYDVGGGLRGFGCFKPTSELSK